MIRDFFNEQVGGLIPLAGVRRTVHTVDGVTYRIELTWFRRKGGFDYHTPRHPRDVRRARALERARLEQNARVDRIYKDAMAARLGADHRFETGDLIPDWVREIPDYVLEVRDSQFDVWSRPATEQEATYDGQRYDWVQRFEGGGVAGWTTNEGLHDHPPLTVTAVAVDQGSARHTA